ncbi:LysR family transcriptional regulator [Terrihabitans soli]|uniref:LysR family transcriptional regulator n=1 Tax=Terrihabitans soli TaxID=708113 RepID=A0A6S6QTF4_9HYPH|nr:SDR family oxidoreductase [Terrihabitans soli]BCJ90552.1 LysR family transcriptional regulator [Terrihabitans soli]
MRIVVLGGTGLIGARVVDLLRDAGHEVVSASPRSGVNAMTGDGLAEAVAGAEVLIDAIDAPSSDGAAVLDFFVAVARNLIAAEAAGGVRHHVALSVVGLDRLQDSVYFRAKAAQEALIRASKTPFTVVRSTQFFELIERLLDTQSNADVVRLPPAQMQPLASDELAEVIADIALREPQNRVLEVAGPEPVWFDELARQILSAREDPRDVVADARSRYFGAELGSQSLMPGTSPRLCQSSVRDWLRQLIPAG